MIDLVVQEQDPLRGRTVAQAAHDYRLLPAAVLTATGDVRGGDAPLEAGDRVVAIVVLGDLETLLRRQGAVAG